MIKLILPFLLLASSFAWAGVQTDTHIYIEDEKSLLIIDKKTDQETLLDIGFESQPIVIHKDIGFLLSSKGEIAVLCLKTHKLIKKSPSLTPDCKHYDRLHIYGDKGFVLIRTEYSRNDQTKSYLFSFYLNDLTPFSKTLLKKTADTMVTFKDKGYITFFEQNRKNSTLMVVNLDNGQLLYEHPLENQPMHEPVIYKSTGYVNLCYNKVQTIDLMTGQLGGTLDIDHLTIYPMVCVGNYGYLPIPHTKKIVIIDLNTLNVTKTLDLPMEPKTVSVHGDGLYVIVREWINNKSKQRLIRINLETHSMNGVNVTSSDYFFFDNLCFGAYTIKNQWVVEVIDLTDFTGITSISLKNATYRALHFSDTNVYWGATKIYPTGPLLFPPNFKGIEMDLWADGEEAFGEFEDHIQRKAYIAAVKPFQIALSTGHPKACAWAAYAFSHGCLGAEIDVEIAGQFWVCMDRTYYNDLTKIGF